MFTVSTSKALVLLSLSVLLLAEGCDRRGADAPDLRPQLDARVAKNFSTSEAEFCQFDLVYSETTGEGETARNEDVSTPVVFTARGKTAIQTTLEATCKALGEADPRTVKACADYERDSSLYKCVAPSILNAAPTTQGSWTCTLDYTANDQDQQITSGKKSTAVAAIEDAFVQCAAKTDDESPVETSIPEKKAPTKTVVASLMNVNLTTSAEMTRGESESPSDATPSPTPSVSPTPTASPVPPPTVYVKPSKNRNACAAAMLANKLVCENSNTYSTTVAKPLPNRRLYRTKKH